MGGCWCRMRGAEKLAGLEKRGEAIYFSEFILTLIQFLDLFINPPLVVTRTSTTLQPEPNLLLVDGSYSCRR